MYQPSIHGSPVLPTESENDWKISCYILCSAWLPPLQTATHIVCCLFGYYSDWLCVVLTRRLGSQLQSNSRVTLFGLCNLLWIQKLDDSFSQRVYTYDGMWCESPPHTHAHTHKASQVYLASANFRLLLLYKIASSLLTSCCLHASEGSVGCVSQVVYFCTCSLYLPTYLYHHHETE